MASKGTSEETKESSLKTKTSEASTKEVAEAEDSSETRETGIVLFRPEARLNPDVLELIFRHLNFKELIAAELVRIHFSSKQN